MSLRVLFVTPWGERLGGAEEMLWMILKHHDRARLEPTVAFLGRGAFVAEASALGVATATIPSGRLRHPTDTIGTIRRLAALLRRVQPDLLLGWSAKPQLYAVPAAALARTGAGVAWWQHALPDGGWFDRIATVLPARAIGFSSEAVRRRQEAMRPRRPSFVVHPGIDLGRRKVDGAGLRQRLGIPADRPVVGIVGRLQPWKGQDRFLEALAELRRRGHDAHGLIVGGTAFDLSPHFAEQLRELVGRLGLEGRVTMTGQVEDAAPHFGLMDVAVNASEGEPFGIVLLEAMAAGVPVVAVATGGPLEIVDPGVTGLLAPDGGPLALADAIGEVLGDPARGRAMGAAGRRRCEERFSAAAMTERLTTKLTEVAGG
jgi:glycosyltransferase involved in cell wall biosynthesis